ncbi:MAG TPA: bifunctional oligoribonuclease/PAP phosphatase NrnA [Desulfobulbaceae bacterium]|nr:bifunctional oligoribonuclease/PAP phosphatase NrnA [Desulfobulbaceae bacterium]
MTGIEGAVGLIARSEKFILVTHIKPDGDALGSLLGLADVLRSMGKRVLCYLEEEVPELYRFLPGATLIETSLTAVRNFQRTVCGEIVVIALDCGDMNRLGKSGPLLRDIHPFSVIDHHKGNGGFGDVNWIEPHRSSTGEMIVDLVEELGVGLSPRAATCLYTALVTDTGSFRYASTSSHTYRVAARLVECGAEPGKINEQLYDNYPLKRLLLMQQVLGTLRMFADDRIGVICVRRSMLEQTGASLADTENFINLPRAVNTVQVAVFFKEGEDMISVSLRSRGDCDVSIVAARFGGGGHALASGFRVDGIGLDDLQNKVLRELLLQLDG